MDSSRPRRKRYCCYYCNTYFYQVDSWQRHNRKHTCVEIECDDCGQMCSDHLELRRHQTTCEAYHVYSDDVYTLPHGEELQNKQPLSVPDDVLETPDSTSKQESLPDMDANVEENQQDDNSESNGRNSAKNSIPPENEGYDGSPDTDQDTSTNPELEHLIGEDKGQTVIEPEEDDPETEALIGIDQDEVSEMNKNNENTPKSSVSSDTQIVINVDRALNDVKQTQSESMIKAEGKPILAHFLNEASPVGPGIMAQSVSLDGSDLNKKYQPYFCKNCGARFTRKDSVTRHLKKGTCSGKSAIVCNICGKVFGEMFELQGHFKSEHKNVVFTPNVVHRSILPRTENHDSQPTYAHFPTHYMIHDQHMVHVNRPYRVAEQAYRPMPPGIQTMFYGNQPAFGPRPVHPPPAHYHDQMVQARAVELKFSPNRNIAKDYNYGKLMLRNEELPRKREHPSYNDDKDNKSRKLDVDYTNKHMQQSPRYRVEKPNENINLSEYTNNAMSSKQYYNSRFVKKEPSAGKDEPPRAHQCKVCGLEFPRFEYLLTHLRKHKEKNEVEPFEDILKENSVDISKSNHEQHPKVTSLNDSNSSSSDDNNIEHHNHNIENRNHNIEHHNHSIKHHNHSIKHHNRNIEHHNHHTNFVTPSFSEKTTVVHPSNQDPVPIVLPQPHHRFGMPNERYVSQHDHIYPPPNQSSEGVEAITPGVDGKFRPFICENCGQRFTRKDSLVRHAKKQTCFEEAAELKCKHCDKTFRYHKCLVQHQELVHGIILPKQPTDDENSESDSERIEFDTKFQTNHEQKYQSDMKHDHYSHDSHSSFHDNHTKYSEESKPEEHRYQPRVEHDEKPYDRFLRRSPVPPSHVDSHHLSPMPKILPPKSEEKLKPSDGKGKDSNYIGYCMLPRPFQCEYCGDRFAHRHSLKRHVRRHLGIGIPCHECGKLYRDQSEWRRHQRSIHNRHYEKYEVPRRMTYKDGVDQGLIGVVSNSQYENHLGPDDMSESENDEDLAMMKHDAMLAKQQQEARGKSPSADSRYEFTGDANYTKTPLKNDAMLAKQQQEARGKSPSADSRYEYIGNANYTKTPLKHDAMLAKQQQEAREKSPSADSRYEYVGNANYTKTPLKHDAMLVIQQQEARGKSPSADSRYEYTGDANYTKTPQNGTHSAIPQETSPANSTPGSFSSRLASFGFHKTKTIPSEESQKAAPIKEEKLKSFNFKSHIAGDKDSRKSVLDAYLCSPSSDDNEEKNNNNEVQKEETI